MGRNTTGDHGLRGRGLLALSLVWALGAGCSVDLTGIPVFEGDAGDAGGMGAGDGGGVSTDPCEGSANGEPCAGGRICVAGACAPSRCGDGYQDVDSEGCEPPNTATCDAACQPCPAGGCLDSGPACAGDEVLEGGVCVPVEIPCTEESLRCAGQAQRTREICTLETWMPAEPCDQGFLCDGPTADCVAPAFGCAGMVPGEGVCIGREHIQCGDDLTMVDSELCPSPEHCTAAGCLPCLAGEYACDGNDLLRCDDPSVGFEMYDGCSPGECNAGLGACTTQRCVPEERSCRDGLLRLCNAAGTAFVETVDCGDYICDAENNQCDACVPGAEYCRDGFSRSVCGADGQLWADEACIALGSTPFCSGAGGCVECFENDTICEDASSIRTCSVDNEWGEAMSCEDQTCVDGACAGLCAPGQGICDGADLTPCGVDGEWAEPQACPVLCQEGLAGTAFCAACAVGEYRCTGDLLQRCNADQSGFEDVNTCGEGLCDASAKTCTGLTCNPGEATCEGNVLVRCNGTGTDFLPPTDCDDVSGTCDAFGDAGAGECDLCDPDTLLGCADADTRQRCDLDGQAVLDVDCPQGMPICTGTGQCVTCLTGTTRCEPDATAVRACSAEQTWGTPTVCGDQTCVAGACQGMCAPGQVQCAGDVRQACDANGMWSVVETCAVACAESAATTRCIVCQPGEYTCSGATLQICNNLQTGFTTANTCANPALCDAPNKVCIQQTCVENAVSCEGDALSVCDATGSAFVSQTPCGQGLCDDVAEVCHACAVGQHRCSGARLEVCNTARTGWDLADTCETEALCDAGNQVCVPSACTANTVTCVGGLLSTCNASGTGFSSQQMCGVGLCNQAAQRCDACTAGQYRCTNAALEVCNGMRTGFITEATCASAALCDAAAEACIPQVCEPSQTTCEGDVLSVCNATGSDFSNQTTCGPNLCDQAGRQCDVCQANQRVSCNGGAAYYLCSNTGQSQSSQACPVSDPVCVGAGDCVECANDTTKCEDTSTYRQCSGNQWSAPNNCVNSTCVGSGVGSACQGSCAPGQSRCSGTTRQTCSSTGVWQNADTCGSGTPICLEEGKTSRCVTCNAGQFNCSASGWLQTCNGTQTGWTNQINCGSQALCNAQSGQCVPPVCTANSVQCLNNTQTGSGRYLTRCNSDGSAYESPVACGSNALCDASGNGGNGECDVCVAGAVLDCAPGGTQQEVCTGNGQGTTTADCPVANPVCVGSGSCVACTNGDTRCATTSTYQLCSSNQWGTAASCGNATCVGSGPGSDCQGSCAPGQSSCSGSTRQTCNAGGNWQNADTCSSGTPICLEEGSTSRCVTCNAGQHRCPGSGWLQVCNGGQTGWSNQTNCGSQALCDAANGQCQAAVCTPDAVQCLNDDQTGSGRYLTRCNGDGSAYETPLACASAALCDAANNECDTCVAGMVTGCWNGSQQRVCNGAGQGTGPVDCPAGRPLCVGSGSCVQCNSGDTECIDGENAYRACDGTGTYSVTVQCTATDVDNFQVCRDGDCENSLPVLRGHYDSVNWSGRLGLFANSWWVTELEVPVDLRLFELHAVLDNVPSGATVRMAIYSNNNNAPASRLTWTSITGVGGGDNDLILAEGRRITLTAGVRYWIAINVSADGMQLHFESVLDNSADDYNYWFDPPTTNLTSSAPSSFDSLTGWFRGDGRFGLFVEGKELY